MMLYVSIHHPQNKNKIYVTSVVTNPAPHRWTASRQCRRFVGFATVGSSRPSSATSYLEPTSKMPDPTFAVLTMVSDRSVHTF